MNRRIIKDITDVSKDITETNTVICDTKISENIYGPHVIIIKGPIDSPYEGGKYHLCVLFPSDYPMSNVKLTMTTKIYHPNINEHEICLDILKKNSVGMLSLKKILEIIYMLMAEPNPADSLNPDIGRELRENKDKFIETAKSWTDKYAK